MGLILCHLRAKFFELWDLELVVVLIGLLYGINRFIRSISGRFWLLGAQRVNQLWSKIIAARADTVGSIPFKIQKSKHLKEQSKWVCELIWTTVEVNGVKVDYRVHQFHESTKKGHVCKKKFTLRSRSGPRLCTRGPSNLPTGFRIIKINLMRAKKTFVNKQSVRLKRGKRAILGGNDFMTWNIFELIR